jgi:hypothetical protein
MVARVIIRVLSETPFLFPLEKPCVELLPPDFESLLLAPVEWGNTDCGVPYDLGEEVKLCLDGLFVLVDFRYVLLLFVGVAVGGEGLCKLTPLV